MLTDRPIPRLLLLAAAIGALVSALPASAGKISPEDAARILPVAQVRAGMEGYGLTVFKGATIERFDVKVLGVMPNSNAGRPLILVRIGGGVLDKRPINVAEGMSGSPVLVNGKIIGAIAYAGSFAMEPIGLVTPIEDMLETWDPSLPAEPLGTGQPTPLPQPIEIGGKTVRSFAISPGPGAAQPAADSDCAWFRPLMGSFSASGLSQRSLAELNRNLAGFSAVVREGPGRMPDRDLPLREGSAVGFSLVTGDAEMTGIGTVTYRRGDRILAFGHPFLGVGPIAAPMSTVWVHDVFTSYMSSFKLASPVTPIGVSSQDLPFAVSGVMGGKAEMVPVEIAVEDGQSSSAKPFRASVIRHPLLTPVLLRLVASEAVIRKQPYPGDTSAVVKLTVTPKGLPDVVRTNVFFSSVDIAAAAMEDMDSVLTILGDNRFAPVGVEKVRLDIALHRTRQTAQIERAFIDKSKFEPGEAVDVSLQIRPYKQQPVIRKVSLTIPENAMDGRAFLVVQGGMSGGIRMAGGAGGEAGAAIPLEAAEDLRNAQSVEQMLRRYQEFPSNNQILARVVLPTGSFSVNGERLTGLPPVMESALQSSKSTGMRLLRDEAKAIEETGWMVSGAQMLPITIERKSLLEKAAPRPSTASSSGATITIPQPSGEGSGSSIIVGSSDEEEEETAYWTGAAAGTSYTVAVEETEVSTGKSPEDKPETTTTADSEEDGTDAAAKKPGTSDQPKLPDLGRAAQTWNQATQTDFMKGELKGTAVGSRGGIEPGYEFRELARLESRFVWAVAGMGDGAIAAATGPEGAVWQVSSDGKVRELFRTGGALASALVWDGSRLWAGSSPDGVVWVYDGKEARKAASLPAKHVSALAPAPDGGVYAATGDGGWVWKVSGDGGLTPVADTGQRHVQCLSVGADGALYAGTANKAAVYRVHGGVTEPLFLAAEDGVTSVAPGPGGSVYASTGPKGKVYRIEPGKAPVVVLDKLTSPFAPLASLKDGGAAAVDGQNLQRLRPEDSYATSQSETPLEVYCCTALDGGKLALGTTNDGSVWIAEPAAKPCFESAIRDAERPASWGSIRVAAEGAPGGVTVWVRGGNTDYPDSTWTPWLDVSKSLNAGQNGVRYLQYRLDFGPAETSARVTQAEFNYLPANRAPTVKFTQPSAGAYWSGKQDVKWTGTDPDKDKLSYELSYSADAGKTWKSLETASKKPSGDVKGDDKPSPKPDAKEPDGQGDGEKPEISVEEEMKKELDKYPELPEKLREQVLESAPAIAESIKAGTDKPEDGDGDSKEKAETSTSSETNGTSRQWDTTKVADGEYLLKVVASDRLANGSGALTGEMILGPVRICNSKPYVTAYAALAEFGPGDTLTIEGRAESKCSPVKTVQFRIDGKGEWASAEPADGLFDQADEHFVIHAVKVKPGKHAVEVQVKDAAGNSASVKRDVEPNKEKAAAGG